jgi:glycosyltransferase involved in cell wall biosynthesis
LEGFSSALLEAMAASLPVAVTRAPGIVDQVQNGIQGLLSDCKNPDQLVASMQTLVDLPDRREEFSKNAFLSAREFGWRRTAQKYEIAYRNMLQQLTRRS